MSRYCSSLNSRILWIFNRKSCQWNHDSYFRGSNKQFLDERTDTECFFSRIPNFSAWADKFGWKNVWHFGYFLPNCRCDFIKTLTPLCIGIQGVVGPALAFAMGMKGVANFPFCHPLFLGRIELSTIYLLLPLFGTFLLFSSCYWACQLDWRSFSAIDRIFFKDFQRLLRKKFRMKCLFKSK